MAINMEELLRAFGRPNVVEVGSVPQPPAMLPQPARAPVAAQAPMQAPQAAQRPRGLLGGFFGPEGRDARSRLAIGLEGLAMNPNQALIGQLQQGIESRETSAQKNATIEWLLLRGHDDLAAALDAGASPQDVLAESVRRMQPQDPMDALNYQIKQLELQNLQNPQPGFRDATSEEAARYGAMAGQFDNEGKFYPFNPPSQGITQTITNPDGTTTTIQVGGTGQGGGGGKPATEGQLAGAGYLQRMTAAESILRDIETRANVVTIPLEKTLLLGTGLEGYTLNPVEQQVAQAQRDWVRAKLRKESGAVIGPEEMAAEIQTYFPMPGEGQETIAQKAEARRRAERQMQIGAGSAAGEAGIISPSYSAPIRMDELGRSGIGGGTMGGGAPVRIANDAEFDALPSGTRFIGPDGQTREKP